MNKKIKKQITRARNRKTQIIVQHAKTHQAERDAALEAQEAALETQARAAESSDPGTEVWSAKTQEIRNRLTNKKRKANDRWNRFAGTAGGGGMGR